jgi:hypothetical protein
MAEILKVFVILPTGDFEPFKMKSKIGRQFPPYEKFKF